MKEKEIKLKPAKRIEKVPPYLFAEIDEAKEAIQEKGMDVIDFGIGDPDLPAPNEVIEELYRASKNPKNHNYPPYYGTKEYKAAVANWYKQRFGVTLDPVKEVIALIGSKEGIGHIFWAFVDPGDYALIPDPGYPVYNVGPLFAGGTPYPMPLLKENNFLPNFGKIPKHVLEKAKLMFINYPNNPTGAIAPKDFFQDAIKFAKKHDILICSDLAYSEMAYDGYIPPSILEFDGAKDVCIEFHSLSKTFNVTGFRIGMAAGNKEAIRALGIIKTNIDSGAFKAIQEAGIFALKNCLDFPKQMVEIYTKRRDALIDGLNSLGWNLEKPKATFYVWAKVPQGYSSKDFCKLVLEKTGILFVPGNGYGASGEGYFRAALTVSEERIQEAISRLNKEKIMYT